MSRNTGFYKGRLGIGLLDGNDYGAGNGNPLYPLEIDGDIRLTGAILDSDGRPYSSGGGLGIKGVYSKLENDNWYFGFGKSDPAYALDVSGSINITGTNAKIYIDGTEAVFSNWENPSGTNTSDIYRNSKVGIGDFSSATIDAPLHVVGDLKLTGAIVCSNTGTTDDVLKKTASGMAWGTIETGKWDDATDGINYSGGKVGIGTSSPKCKINTNIAMSSADNNIPTYTGDITGNKTTDLFLGKSTASTQNYWGMWMGTVYQSPYGSYIQAGANNSHYPLLLQPKGGNVGIGTTSPQSRLDVVGGNFRVYRNVTSQVHMQIQNSRQHWQLGVNNGGNGTDNDQLFIYNVNDSAYRLTIQKGTGNVGIGTTSPSTLLVVGEDGGGHATHTPGIHMKSTVGDKKCYCVGQDSTHNIVLTYIANSTLGNGYASLHTYGGNNDLSLMKDGGNVGIGTESPGTKLEITSLRSNQIRLTSYDTTIQTNEKIGGIEFYSMDDTSAGVKAAIEVLSADQSGTSYMTFSAGTNTEKMRIDKDGNVGIGTTSPQAPLHIVDKDSIGSASEVLRLQRGESTGDINASSKGSIGMYLEDDNNGGGEVAKIEWRHDGTDGSLEGKGTLSFWTSNTGGVDGVPEERMTIRASGNVGIGTSTPTSKLHVVGDTRITGNLLMGGTAQDGTPSKIHIGSNNSDIPTGSDDALVYIGGDHDLNGTLLKIADYNNDSSHKQVVFYSENNTEDYFFQADESTGGKHYYRGNVGIGTTSPTSPLDVYRASSSFGKIAEFGTINGPRIAFSNTNDNGILLGNTHSSSHSLGIISAGDIYISMDHNGNSSGKKISFGQNLSDNSIFRDALIDNGGSSWQEYMTIKQGGNVGIGTTSPDRLLHIQHSNTGYASNPDSNLVIECNDNHNNWLQFLTKDGEEAGLLFGSSTSTAHGAITHRNTDGMTFRTGGGNNTRMVIDETGNVGIGTTSPVVKLQVAPSAAFTNPSNFQNDGTYISDVLHKRSGDSQNYFSGHSTGASAPWYSVWAGDYDKELFESTNATSAYFEAGIMVGGRIFLESDERIKHEIQVINDSFALRTIREIECYTYFYNDMIRRTPEITFGFLAQEVKEKLPMAVKIKTDFLPAAMTFAQDISWEEIIDDDGKNKFKLTIPILHKDASNNIVEHEPGTKFKFYLTDVSNNINNQDFCVSTLLEDGKSFILDKKSKYVFIYGYLVDDFHILDKEKIFILHHSAIQELDRQQQADKAKIAELENKNQTLENEVATLKSELAAIKTHLGL